MKITLIGNVIVKLILIFTHSASSSLYASIKHFRLEIPNSPRGNIIQSLREIHSAKANNLAYYSLDLANEFIYSFSTSVLKIKLFIGIIIDLRLITFF